MARLTVPLAAWEWRMAASNGDATAESLAAIKEWAPVSAFPSVVHMELLAAGLIPDYNIGENERLMQWAGHVDWEYRAVFPTPETKDRGQLDLVLEGLDTFATVYLNGAEVLKSDNMFIPARLPVREALRPAGEENTLRIVFESAIKAATALEEQHGVRWSRMRSPKRNHVRKAQYHWGWDWGPVVLTAGPYLPVYLEAYDLRIEDVYVQTNLADDHSTADVAIEVKVAPVGTQPASVRISVVDADGTEVFSASPDIFEDGEAYVKFAAASPRLWWSNGLGQQHLYTAHVTLLDAGSDALDASSTRFGIREVELIQRDLDDEPGKTFMFRINGVDVFAQGVNWIPASNLLPTVTRARYFDWIRTVAFAHMNMIRVWGGGIYETVDFFDACDELGVLVWHDYAFACGDYPLHEEFLASVKKEAEVQTTRIRNRASLALLCGGNEDFMMYDWLKRGPDYDHDDVEGPFDDQPFPQRKIFLSVLPEVAGRLCPSLAYWPSSPWGGGQVNDLTVGDVHQWEVWHMSQAPYQDYPRLAGRFVSEFGMQALPVGRTVSLFFDPATPPAARHPLSRAADCHNKGRGSHTRLARYLADNVRYAAGDGAAYGYATQLVQAEAYAGALRGWRRRFAGPGAEATAGALIWQLNDVYPVTSWALVDCFARPKPAYYATRRACAPLAVGAERTPASRCVDENDPPRAADAPPSFALYGLNATRRDVPAALVLRAFDMAAGEWTALPAGEARREVTLPAGYATELGRLAAQPAWAEGAPVVLEVTLLGAAGEVLARAVDWPEPLRYLHWPRDTRLTIRVGDAADGGEGGWENELTLVANQPLKGVWLEPVYDGTEAVDGPEPLWEDNMVDLMPGDELRFRVKGLRGREVAARFLADWEVGGS